MPGDFETRLAAVLDAHPARRVQMRGTRAAAVLLPLVGGPEPSLLLTVRTDTVPSHRGQISFPGGSIDRADRSARAAALREAHEEIGLDPSAVRVLGELDALPTFVSGYLIAPFVGWVDGHAALRPNPAEVAEILEVPVTELTESIRRSAGFVHGGRDYPTEAWIWKGHVIWGATARILRSFLELVAAAGLTEPPGDEPDWPHWARLGTGP